MTKAKLVILEGRRVQVIRPDKPEIPLALAKAAEASQDKALMANLPAIAESQGVQYFYVGLLARRGKEMLIIDDNGHYIGKMQPGDSMVSNVVRNVLPSPIAVPQ
jgi:hypothetical protein